MPSKRIAIAGLGEIGKTVARKLAQGLPGLALAGITTRDQAKAQAWLDREGICCPLVSLDELPDHADLVVECAPAAILDQICRPMLSAGKQVMVLSSSALLPVRAYRPCPGAWRPDHRLDRRLDRPRCGFGRRRRRRPLGPAATRKPPGGLAGAPYLVENGISMEGVKSALCVFKGSARDAAAAFPANVNVVAALSLAGSAPIVRRSRSGPILM